jgi:hypothetical protein
LTGPGAYYNPAPEAALQSSKAFSFGARLAAPARAAAGADSPGPASYAVPEDGGGPAYTIGGRLKAAGEVVLHMYHIDSRLDSLLQQHVQLALGLGLLLLLGLLLGLIRQILQAMLCLRTGVDRRTRLEAG